MKESIATEVISVHTPRERLNELIELSRKEVRQYPKSMGALSYFMHLLQLRATQDTMKGNPHA